MLSAHRGQEYSPEPIKSWLNGWQNLLASTPSQSPLNQSLCRKSWPIFAAAWFSFNSSAPHLLNKTLEVLPNTTDFEKLQHPRQSEGGICSWCIPWCPIKDQDAVAMPAASHCPIMVSTPGEMAQVMNHSFGGSGLNMSSKSRHPLLWPPAVVYVLGKLLGYQIL